MKIHAGPSGPEVISLQKVDSLLVFLDGSREKMILGQIEVGSGVIPGGGGSVYLPLLVGRSHALRDQ